jgi:uncharacterized protein (DUF488 family)
VDVRSSPGSPWVSYANPRDLERILKKVGIEYLYLGDLLGGRPSEPNCYNPDTGRVNYLVMQEKDSFKQGIDRILERCTEHRLCLMCAEEDPSHCHRNLMVGEGLRKKGVKLLHIRGSGQIQTDEELWKEQAGVKSNQLSLPL